MASVERRHGYSGASSDEEHCGMRRIDDDNRKKGKRKGRLCSFSFLNGFISELKLDPTRALKRLFCKLLLYVWCIAVILSILSLLGFKINPFVNYQRTTVTSDSDISSGVESIDKNVESSLWSSVLGEVFSDEEKEENNQEEDNDVDIDIPQQVVSAPVKEGNKINKKLERTLACDEVQCINACNNKIKPKCAKSRTCRNDRDKICHRRCRKARCEDRCKDEPKFGYVEREQRMDKCKEECTGPTAAHNKCIKRCHSQFKPCKSRCHEIAHKFVCDIQPSPLKAPSDDTPPKQSKSKASKTMALLEDPEMI